MDWRPVLAGSAALPSSVPAAAVLGILLLEGGGHRAGTCLMIRLGCAPGSWCSCVTHQGHAHCWLLPSTQDSARPVRPPERLFMPWLPVSTWLLLPFTHSSFRGVKESICSSINSWDHSLQDIHNWGEKLLLILATFWLRRWRICLQCSRPGFGPWVGKIPWRREWQPTPAFLPGEFHGRRSLAGYI